MFTNCVSPTGNTIIGNLAQLITLNGTSFMNNSQTDLYLIESSGIVDKTSFTGTAASSIVVSMSSLQMTNSNVTNSANLNSLGKGLYAIGRNLTLKGNLFSNLTAAVGGAIYLATDTSGVFSNFLFKF